MVRLLVKVVVVIVAFVVVVSVVASVLFRNGSTHNSPQITNVR